MRDKGGIFGAPYIPHLGEADMITYPPFVVVTWNCT